MEYKQECDNLIYKNANQAMMKNKNNCMVKSNIYIENLNTLLNENLNVQDKNDDDEWNLFNETLEDFNVKIENTDNVEKHQNNINLNKKNMIKLEKIDNSKCPNCNIQGKIKDTTIICENCGLERKWDNETNNYCMSFEQNYNTSSNAFMSFSIVGKGSYCYQRSFLKTCSNYSCFRNNINKKEIINKIYQYKGNKLPANVCNDTAELFDTIKQKNYVFRGNGKWGVIGACLYYSCIKNNLTRTPREIADIIGIEDRFLSQGDRTLRNLNELGIINISTNSNPLNDYLNQYLPILGIDLKFKQFIIDIIARAEKKFIHVGNESRTTSKAIGAIYLLTKRIPKYNHIKKNYISEEVKISKSTFIRYYNLLISHPKQLKKVFKKHKVPMELSWKEI